MEAKMRKVLICDDSMLMRKKLKELLVEMDCEVIEATNGIEAVEGFKSYQPSVVFMDIVMPEVDGLEALNQIMSYNSKAYVVMLSSTGTSTKLIQALKGGARDFIQKPYTKEQIAKIINSL